MKALGIFLSLTFTLSAHAQWVDVWQASPNVWEEPTNPARLQVSDFEILKKSGLSKKTRERLLQSCVRKFSDSKSYYVSDGYGNNYQVSEVSAEGEVRASCRGRVAETFCQQEFNHAKITNCLSDHL